MSSPSDQPDPAPVTDETTMAPSEKESVTVLLIGRTGNGKSSTGNYLLNKKAFTPMGGSSSSAIEVLKESTTVDDLELTVVDGIDIGDGLSDKLENVQALLDAANKALDLSSEGFSALLIVLKYGVRFTKQEKDALMVIKSLFGSDIVKNYGVIVMTHGDSFDLDMEDEAHSFEDWCKEQSGDVKALFQECEYRCVLFNNKSKEEARLAEQRNTLISMITGIQSRVGNYTEKEFSKANIGRKKLIVQSKIPMLETETRKVIDEISSNVDRLTETDNRGSGKAEQELQSLRKKLHEHRQYLEDEDQGTKSMDRLMGEVQILDLRIQTSLRMLKLPSHEAPEPPPRMPGPSQPEIKDVSKTVCSFSLLRATGSRIMEMAHWISDIFWYWWNG